MAAKRIFIGAAERLRCSKAERYRLSACKESCI